MGDGLTSRVHVGHTVAFVGIGERQCGHFRAVARQMLRTRNPSTNTTAKTSTKTSTGPEPNQEV